MATLGHDIQQLSPGRHDPPAHRERRPACPRCHCPAFPSPHIIAPGGRVAGPHPGKSGTLLRKIQRKLSINHPHVAPLHQQTGKQARDAHRGQRPRPHLAIRLDAPKHRATLDPGRCYPVQNRRGRPPDQQRNEPSVVSPDSHRLSNPFVLRLRRHQALRVRQAPARQGLRQQTFPPHQRHDGPQAQTFHVGPPTGLSQRRQPPLQQPGQRSHALEPHPRGPVGVG